MKHITHMALTLSLAAHLNMVMAHPDAAVKTAPEQAQAQVIGHVLKKQFDKPQSPLTVTPVMLSCVPVKSVVPS